MPSLENRLALEFPETESCPGCPIGVQEATQVQFQPQRRAYQSKESGKALENIDASLLWRRLLDGGLGERFGHLCNHRFKYVQAALSYKSPAQVALGINDHGGG